MADKSFSILAQLSLNDEQFKNSIKNVRSNVQNLIKGVEGATGNITEMRKALMTLRNVSFAGKTKEEIAAINQQIGQLTDDIGDLKAQQKAMGTEFGSVLAKGMQGLAALGEVVVGVASMFGASKEQAEKYQKAMVQLIGVSQAFATIQSIIEERTIQIIVMKVRDTAVTIAQTIATKAATIAQWAFNASLMVVIGTVAIIVAAIAALAAGIYFLVKAFNKSNQEQQDFVKKQKLIKDVSIEAQKSIVDEKVKLDLLVRTARDKTKSDEERKKAIDELNKNYPVFNGNLNTENINTKATTESIKKQNDELLRNATIQAAKEKLIEIEKKYIDDIVDGKAAEVSIWQQSINLVKAGGNAVTASAYNGVSAVNNLTEAEQELTKQRETLYGIINAKGGYTGDEDDKETDKVKEKKTAYELLTAEISKLEDKQKSILAQGGVVDPKEFDLLNQKILKLKEINAELEKQKAIAFFKNIPEPSSDLMKGRSASIKNEKDKKDEVDPLGIKKLAPMTDFVKSNLEKVDKILEESQKKFETYRDAFVYGFSQIGNSIVNSLGLASDGIQGFAGVMLKFVTDTIAQFLGTAIAAAITSGQIAASFTGALAIFTGPAFIAAAIASVLTAFAAIPKFATGGIVPGSSYSGDNVPVMANSGEMILNKSQQSNLFSMLNGSNVGGGREVVFKIQGTELVGVLNNHSRKINSIR